MLQTNEVSLSMADVALGYKGMWIIESCFRHLKPTGLGILPMCHWTPRRIAAHVKLCVLALMIQRAAEFRIACAWIRIAADLTAAKAVRYRARETTIVQTSKFDAIPAAVLKKLEISMQKPILAID